MENKNEKIKEVDNSALHKTNVSRSFKWRATRYYGTPLYTRIEEESEDENGEKILSFWDKNETPKFQTYYKGKLINSSDKQKSEFGRMFGEDLVSFLFKLHKEAKAFILNCG